MAMAMMMSGAVGGGALALPRCTNVVYQVALVLLLQGDRSSLLVTMLFYTV